MSIPSNKIFVPSNGINATLRAMPAKPAETLGMFIARVREEKDLTFQQIADASGGRVSQNYVHNIVKGTPTEKLSGRIMLGLAKGLGESPLLIFQLAMGLTLKLKDESLQQLLEDYAGLPKDDQSDLRLMIELLRKEIFDRRKRAQQD